VIPNKQYSFDTILQIARRRKWLIVLPAAALALVGSLIVTWLPDQFRSETLILVVPQRVPETYVRSTVTSRIEDRLQAISQQILSRTRLEQIISDFNLYAKERANQELMEDIVERMRTRDIGITIIKGDAFRVSYTANDPRLAMRVTERLGSLFIDESLRDREVLADGTTEFLATQLDEAQRKLVANENKLLEYQRTHDGELPAQMGANLQALHNAEMALRTVGDSANRTRERRIALERAVADLLNTPDAKPAVPEKPKVTSISLEDELETQQKALLALELKLRPEHPDVRKQKRAVDELQKRVDTLKLAGELTPRPAAGAAPATAMDPEKRKRLLELRSDIDDLDREIQGKVAEEARLQAMVSMYQSRIQAAPLREAELATITRDYETLQDTYRSLLQKKEESQISANLEKRQIGEQFKILDPARMPEKPASPDRPKLYVLALLVALVMGGASAGLAEYFDRTLKTESDVQSALNLKVLATVPFIRDAVARRRRWRQRLAVGAVATTALVMCAGVAWRLLR
jgi:polysaccharide chain length determinant protein (PEP-CTERM system associated)